MLSCNLKPFFCFQDQKFDIGHLAKYFQSKRADGDLAIYYELESQERVETRGILEVCPFSKRISRFLEKPKPDETTSRNASVVFYFFRSQTRKFILKLVFNYTATVATFFSLFIVKAGLEPQTFDQGTLELFTKLICS